MERGAKSRDRDDERLMPEMSRNWHENMANFVAEMSNKIEANEVEKGTSWRTMSSEQLLPLIQKYIERRDYVSVANIAFMLWENRKVEKTMRRDLGMASLKELFEE